MASMRLNTRPVVILAAACAAMASAWGCSFLLDTEKLQEGAGAQGGSGGAPSDAAQPDQDSSIDIGPNDSGAKDTSPEDTTAEDVTASEPPTTCEKDDDCLAKSDGSLCQRHVCDTKNKVCLAPTAYSGPVVHELDAAPVKVVWDKDEVGVPRLLVDGDNVYLAAWFKDLNGTDIFFRKYDALLGDTTTAFKTLFNPPFPTVVSSPGMTLDKGGTPLQDGVAMVIAAGYVSPAKPCVRLMWMSADMSQSDFVPQCLVVNSEYDTDPTRSAPQLIKRSNGNVPMWIQGGELFVNSLPVTTLSAGVRSFSEFLGPDPNVGAILQGGPTANEEQTYRWYSNNTSPSVLSSVSAGARLGSATALAEQDATTTTNLVAWSYPSPNNPVSTIELIKEDCGLNCTQTAFKAPGDSPPEALNVLAPALATRRLSSPSVVDLLSATVIADNASTTTSAKLMGQFIRLGSPSTSMNPPSVAISSSATLSAQLKMTELPSLLGQTAAAITPSGMAYVVWVQRDSTKKATLYLRRYQILQDCHTD